MLHLVLTWSHLFQIHHMLCTYILHIHMYMCTYVYVYLHTHMSLSIFMCARSLQSCPTLRNPLGCSPSGFPVHGILQERILEWVAAPSFRDLPNPGIEPTSLMSPTLAVGFFTTATCLMMAVGQSQSRSRSQLGSDWEGVNCLAHDEAIIAQQT